MPAYFKFFFLVCVCMVCIGFASCKKNNTEPKNETPASLPVKEIKVSDEIKAYGCFNKNSYLIYRDSVYHTTDSVYITSITTRSLTTVLRDTLFIYEQLTVHYNRSFLTSDNLVFSSFPEDHITLLLQTVRGPQECIIFKTDSTLKNDSSFSTKFVNNLTVEDTAYNDLLYAKYSYVIDMFTATGSNNVTNAGYGYWKKNVGMVKLQSRFGSYNLIRYHN